MFEYTVSSCIYVLQLPNHILLQMTKHNKLVLPLPALYRGINIIAKAESSNTNHALHKPDPIFLLNQTNPICWVCLRNLLTDVKPLPHACSYLPFQPRPCEPVWSLAPICRLVFLWQWSKQQSRLLCWKKERERKKKHSKTSYICCVFCVLCKAY